MLADTTTILNRSLQPVTKAAQYEGSLLSYLFVFAVILTAAEVLAGEPTMFWISPQNVSLTDDIFLFYLQQKASF